MNQPVPMVKILKILSILFSIAPCTMDFEIRSCFSIRTFDSTIILSGNPNYAPHENEIMVMATQKIIIESKRFNV